MFVFPANRLNPVVFKAETPRRPHAGRGIRRAKECSGNLNALENAKRARWVKPRTFHRELSLAGRART